MLEAPFKWRLPLVVLGAGRGRRLGSASGGVPKILLPIAPPDTVLDLLVRAFAPWAERLHLVVAADTGPVREALERQPLPAKLHLQPEPDGTVNALLRLAPDLPDRFVVLLGDCLVRGRLDGPPDDPFPGIGVWQKADRGSVLANYAVTLEGERVAAVEEKPAAAKDDHLCGIGVYFLNRRFMETMADLPASRLGRRELTDALQHYLENGGELLAFRLSGSYVNINTPEDLRRARQLFGQP